MSRSTLAVLFHTSGNTNDPRLALPACRETHWLAICTRVTCRTGVQSRGIVRSACEMDGYTGAKTIGGVAARLWRFSFAFCKLVYPERIWLL